MFRITAQTRKGWGEAAEALVVTTEKRGTHTHTDERAGCEADDYATTVWVEKKQKRIISNGVFAKRSGILKCDL